MAHTWSFLVPPSADGVCSLHKPIISPLPLPHLIGLGHVPLLAGVGRLRPHEATGEPSLTGRRGWTGVQCLWLATRTRKGVRSPVSIRAQVPLRFYPPHSLPFKKERKRKREKKKVQVLHYECL